MKRIPDPDTPPPFVEGEIARERAFPHWSGPVHAVEWSAWPDGKLWGWRVVIEVRAGDDHEAPYFYGWLYGARADHFERVET